MLEKPVVVVGAGFGGLAAAIHLASAGERVLLLERQAYPGGKARQVPVGGARINGGPTVLTMRWVFDDLLQKAGDTLERAAQVQAADLLARHVWNAGGYLDLFEEPSKSAAAIESFSDVENAEGYLRFCADSADVFERLKTTFIDAQRPGPFELTRRMGFGDLSGNLKLRPFSTLWKALGDYFPDKRLRQLFGRYATYCGSSPFEAPATLMLVAHVEQCGGWRLPGGMSSLAVALVRAAQKLGVTFQFETEIDRIDIAGGRVQAVRLAGGDQIDASSIVFNGDVSALPALLRPDNSARSFSPLTQQERSLSAVTFAMNGKPTDFPLAYHTVFFASDYQDEFDAVFRRGTMSPGGTVYVCAQDRLDDQAPAGAGKERLLCLVNAPAAGDRNLPDQQEVASCLKTSIELMERCGLNLDPDPADLVTTGPTDFHRLFPASGGALYGPKTHGWMGAFNRAANRTEIPGLYLAGGSVHPGPGVPMAALSGKLAAECLVLDRGSMRRFRRGGIFGGMSTA
ncbi:phytoene desaturase [Roseibium hamelinense]|nr:1-hydroxycarotenoid 3,4-desaturase CrtD [Roseibium hamelinense]MTI44838.1 phytoene desaturase [Roseibium hamelinense]